MQTEWRVACVRIPRFPIGAVYRGKRAGSGDAGAQLHLTLVERSTAECSSTPDTRHPERSLPRHPERSEGSTRLETDASLATLAQNGTEHWDNQLLALTDGAPNRPKLRSVSAAAARERVRAGMTLAEARALCGKLDALPWDDAAVTAAITVMSAAFVEVSPQVSPVAGVPGMWWIGASGFAAGARAAGGSGERQFAHALLDIAKQWHPHARVAIAGSCVAARAATWGAFRRDDRSLACVVPPGGDAAYLHSAPLALLPMDDEMRDALGALGIRTIGGFADLPAADVEQRWGDDGLVAWRLSHGDDPRRPVLAHAGDRPHVELELGTPAATMEPVLFLVRPAVENLVSQVVSRGRSIASLAITLTLDDARGSLPNARPHTVTREIRLPRPLARPAPLFERCRGLLSRWTLEAPVSAVRLTVLLTSPLAGEQGNLLDTSWRDPGAAEAALERVRAELGPDVVVHPHARDGYAPERSGSWREDTTTSFSTHSAFSTPTAFSAPRLRRGSVLGVRDATARNKRIPDAEDSGAAAHPARSAGAEHALRLLESPEKVDVDRDDEPRRIFWRGRAIPVIHAIGPERLSGDWWNDGYTRDYWRCESDDERGELMLYRDDAGWWVQGWYD